VVGATEDPRTAWNALATARIIEPEWLTDPHRRFCDAEDEATRSRFPISVPMCLALAADVPGVEAVEALARDLIRALEVWGCPQHTRVAWSYGARPDHRSVYRCRAHAAARAAAEATGGAVENRSWFDETEKLRTRIWEAQGPDPFNALGYAGGEIIAAFWWDLACRRRGIVPPELIPRRPRSARRALMGRMIRTLPSPFERILGIYGHGYALGGITDQDIVLIAPEIG